MSLGDFEQVVLFALLRGSSEVHGVDIALEIENHTGRSVSPGALYTVLDRLETKGYVESWVGESTPERGGRRRKVYRLLPAGARALREWYAGIRALASGMLPRLDALAEESS